MSPAVPIPSGPAAPALRARSHTAPAEPRPALLDPVAAAWDNERL
jgi:hypothetical protein